MSELDGSFGGALRDLEGGGRKRDDMLSSGLPFSGEEGLGFFGGSKKDLDFEASGGAKREDMVP